MADHIELLRRLERDNRRLKGAILVVMVVMAVSVLTAQLTPPERVEAQEFALVSETGDLRAVLGMGRFPHLTFFNADEDLSIALSMSTAGPVLSVVQPDGTLLNYLDGSVGRDTVPQ